MVTQKRENAGWGAGGGGTSNQTRLPLQLEVFSLIKSFGVSGEFQCLSPHFGVAWHLCHAALRGMTVRWCGQVADDVKKH